MSSQSPIPRLRDDDALILVDVQNDFIPGGSLGVPDGDAVIPVLNQWIRAFRDQGRPIFATRDWHPADHCSFKEQGGIWPPHCIAETPGAQFDERLELPPTAHIVSKAATRDRDAYSGFQGTDLAAQLRARETRRVFVGGLATDYCVLNTVLDALSASFEVQVICDAIRAVNLQPDDGDTALQRMQESGAELLTSESA